MPADTESEIGFAHIGLGSVLKQNQLTVPANQREYAWEVKEVTTLFRDIAREISEGQRSYFCGTIVTIPRPNSILEVVDGQQRLATTAIFLSAIRDYLKPSEQDLAKSIDDDFLSVFVRATPARVPRLQLNLDDNDYFRARLAGSTPTPSKPSHNLLNSAFTEAAKYVRTIVAGHDRGQHGNVLNRWVDFIETKSFIILLRVPDASNAYRMFETLNDRGKRVSQSDLVKNYLFGQAGDRLTEVQQKWALMRGALESVEDEDITITFLRHSLTIIRGFVREADVYDAVQKQAIGEQPVVTFAGNLELLAYAFVAIHNPEHEKWNKYPAPTRRALTVLNLFCIIPMRPLLMAIAEKFVEREADLAFTFCVSLGVRLMVSNGTRTGSVEEGIADVAYKIYSGAVTAKDQMVAQLKSITPTDTQFRTVFEGATASNRKLARYYLRALEMTGKGESEPWHIPNDDQSVINLEHILPEKTMGNWPQFSVDEVKIYRNRIGNLALLRSSENSGLQSDSFANKKLIYATCPYILTSQVANEAQWTAAEIIARQKTLAELAVRTWPI
jgi:Protein of unknown function DUF262/Protein of unknown function (DUF1524)